MMVKPESSGPAKLSQLIGANTFAASNVVSPAVIPAKIRKNVMDEIPGSVI